MILATVGLHNKGFERLVQAADELASSLNERVLIQYGSSKYIPKIAECISYTSGEQMENLVREARIVIAHAAAGSILLALQECKPLIVVPRLKEFDEVFDNHQTQLANALNSQGRAVLVNDPSPETLQKAITIAVANKKSSPENLKLLVEALHGQLNKWENFDN
jgi:beta-1,4-N-acetylglucosaminyltransferase